MAGTPGNLGGGAACLKLPASGKLSLVPEASTQKRALPAVVASLAAEYELDLEMLLDWKVYPSGKVVLIAPNGMKLVRELELETAPDMV